VFCLVGFNKIKCSRYIRCPIFHHGRWVARDGSMAP